MGVEEGDVHAVEILVLVEAGEDHADLAGHRVDVALQALRADLLHHALHRRVDRADRLVARLHVRREHRVARGGDGGHHLVGPDRDDAVGEVERDRLRTELAVRADLDASQRSGILTQLGFLASNAYSLDSSDITRYVWGSKRYATVAAFATAVGTETGSTMTVRAITDPSAGLFVNPAAGNFRTRAVGEPTTSIRGAASGSWATAPISEMARVALGLSTTNPAGTGAIFATTTPA